MSEVINRMSNRLHVTAKRLSRLAEMLADEGSVLNSDERKAIHIAYGIMLTDYAEEVQELFRRAEYEGAGETARKIDELCEEMYYLSHQ